MIVYPKQRKTDMDKIDMIRAEIERLKSKYRHNGLWLSSTQSLLAGAKIEAMNELLPFLDSLQQEQQMPDSTQLIAEWEREKAVLEQKDFRGDAERMAYNAFLDGFVKGIGYGCAK